ncbi:hypothetical protein [Nocardia sp. NPDC024068]|uniref:hypothetical protein n=1 Tax=Nocardia sp. NPDC024068 TaxID=3157197 RepID=UPI003401DDF5
METHPAGGFRPAPSSHQRAAVAIVTAEPGAIGGANVVGQSFHCVTCWPRKTETCALCDNDDVVGARWPLGTVCRRCYKFRVNHASPCSSCGRTRVLVGVEPGGGLCTTCCGLELNFTCRRCGRDGRLMVDQTCTKCVAAERARNLLSDDTGTVIPQLQPLLDALADANAGSVITWLRTGQSRKLLSQLVAEHREITHAALDELPQRHATHSIRALLVGAGVLPARNEPLAQLELWSGRTLAQLPPSQQHIIRPFADWHVVRDAYRRAARGPYRVGAASADRTQIRSAIKFLTWLHAQDAGVENLTQDHIDGFLLSHPSKSHPVIVFFRWLQARGFAAGLDIPTQTGGLPNDFQGFEAHQQQLHRCLTDESIPLAARVAGALSRLYALPLVRIVEFTTDRFHRDGTGAFLTIDRHPVLLPPTLARLIDRLIVSDAIQTMIRPGGPGPAYLFPGRPPGRPRHSHSLREMLTEHGLPIRSARNTAMITAAGELPPMVISDLFGVGPGTAQKWAHYAQASWADYLAHVHP